MAFLNRGDSTGDHATHVVVSSTALTSAKPRADDAIFDDIVIECAPLAPAADKSGTAVTLKLTRDEALQLCADIILQLKTLPILKSKPSARMTS